jgi:hypothetical protein
VGFTNESGGGLRSGAGRASAAPTARASRFAIVAGALFVAVWFCALFHGVIFAGEGFCRGDIVALHRPMRTLLVHLWHASTGLPTWNPYFDSGQPFAADPQSAAFHPLSLLFLVLPWETAFSLQVLIPIALSFAAMIFMLRSLGRSPAAAFFGGCVWAFGGFVLSSSELLPVLATAAPVPAVLGCAVRALRREGRGWLLALAATFALETAGGEPATLLATLALLTAAALVNLKSPSPATGGGERSGALRHGAILPVLGVAGALLLGALMAGAVLYPAWRLQSRVERSESIAHDAGSDWHLAPARLVEPIWPRVLGSPAESEGGSGLRARAYPVHRRPLIASWYFGLLPVALALVAAVRRRRRTWPWSAVALTGVLLALGSLMPVWPAVQRLLPFARALRYPERWLFVAAFALSVIAAEGLELVVEDARARRLALGVVAFLGVCSLSLAAGASILTTRPGDRAAVAHGWLGSAGLVQPTTLHDCLVQALIAGASIVVLCSLGRWGASVGMPAILVLVAVDLTVAGRPLVPSEPIRSLERAPTFLAPLAREPDHGRLFHLAENQHECTNGASPRMLAAPRMPAQWLIPMAFDTDFDQLHLRVSHRAAELFWRAVAARPDLMEPLLARHSVGAILHCRGADANVHSASDSPPGTVHLDLSFIQPRPLASCVDRVATVPHDQAWLAEAERLGPALASSAIVTGKPGEFPAMPSPCSVEMVRSAPDRLLLEVASRGPAASFLAVNQTWDPGWSVTVDDHPRPLVRTDIALSGVLVPPGAHVVELSYRDASVEEGVIASLGGLLIWGVLCVLAWRTPQRRRRSPPTNGGETPRTTPE